MAPFVSLGYLRTPGVQRTPWVSPRFAPIGFCLPLPLADTTLRTNGGRDPTTTTYRPLRILQSSQGSNGFPTFRHDRVLSFLGVLWGVRIFCNVSQGFVTMPLVFCVGSPGFAQTRCGPRRSSSERDMATRTLQGERRAAQPTDAGRMQGQELLSARQTASD